jgi:FlaG/FlaF family flagellin (archaellin)
MRLIFSTGMLVALVVALIVLHVAASMPAARGQADKKGQEVKTETVRGNLQSVDNNRVKVKSDAKDIVTVQLDSQTRITVDGKSATLTDLKAGLAATCTFVRREGMNVAVVITATSVKK